MTFGQSDSEAVMQHVAPDAFKSDVDKAKEDVQQDVRHITGNTHGHSHDAFRQDSGGIANSLKPCGQQSFGDEVKQKTDQAQSQVQPNGTKSIPQQTRDYVTPGNDSAGAGGILRQIKDTITGHSSESTHAH
ncbi:hypothetical protein AYX14_06708 [Cryptococcus neoformans]|nr:hypothetical protein AYX15_06736 [Cryptococcus neoformans var. grubii]OWZ63484.1 hypothetical protein AYX14_06708 [Cryptococcus neoformans var. grubii]